MISQRTPELPSVEDHFSQLRADYDATKTGRHVKQRTGLLSTGSNADWHWRNPTDYYRTMEYARDLDQNDDVVRPAVTRVVDNVVQQGINVEPVTGDDEADAIISERWTQWSEDEQAVDIQEESDFAEMTRTVFRHGLVDGDVFGVPLGNGQLEAIEGHRCRSSTYSRRGNTVLGVSMTNHRKRTAYYFTREEISPFGSIKWNDLKRYWAYDNEGNRNVFQYALRSRLTQTRGVSVLMPIINMAGQREDADYAALIKQKLNMAITLFRQRDIAVTNPADRKREAMGPQRSATDAFTDPDGWESLVEKISPGMEVIGKPGEKLIGFAPNVPAPTYFEHIRLILTYMAINLGLPLSVLLLDPSDTNFSGYRGALDEARRGFRCLQTGLGKRWVSPVYKWKVRQFIAEDVRLQRLMDREGIRLYRHNLQYPSWGYIEPKTDAAADVLIIRNGLDSPRNVYAKRGKNYQQVGIIEAVNDHFDKWVYMSSKHHDFHMAMDSLWGDDIRKPEVNLREFATGPGVDNLSAQYLLDDTEPPQPQEAPKNANA